MKPEERYKHYYNEGYNEGSVKGYEQAIEKACKWLKNYAHIYVSETTGDLYENDLINNFRKDMKGEQI